MWSARLPPPGCGGPQGFVGFPRKAPPGGAAWEGVSGASHAGVVRRYYARWAGDRQGVFHDGEQALHSPPAKEAYAGAGVSCLKLPPYSPDMNPIENAWAVLNARMEATKPKGWERE